MSTTDVLKLQGNYLVQTARSGQITLDTTNGENLNGSVLGTGTVVVTGNLVVYGDTTFGSTVTNLIVENTKITDNEITLNAGEFSNALNGAVTKGTAGIKISRGKLGQDQDQYAAFIAWNDNAHWQGTGAISNINGLFEFRVGRTGRPQYSAIKVNAIRIDENSASTAGTGAGQGVRLNIFGSDNPTAVISVSGTNNYEARVTDDDDIPNKKYVDDKVLNYQTDAERTIVGKSWLTVIDQYSDVLESEIIAVVDGDPSLPRTAYASTSSNTGTIVMRVSKNSAEFNGIQLVGNMIQPTSPDADLKLATNGYGQIKLQAPLLFLDSNVPIPGIGETGLYTGPTSGGGTGVFFKRQTIGGDFVQDEFISRKKALVYSIIFG